MAAARPSPPAGPPFLAAWRDADADGPLTVRIDAAGIETPDHGGVMLADISRHMARALAQSGKAADERSALIRILNLFENELRQPTDAIDSAAAN